MTSPNTVATSIVDKNGKSTTVHKNLNKGVSSAASRVSAVASKPPAPPYQRAVRTALGELHKDKGATIKKRNVDYDWGNVKRLLESDTPYFGKFSDALFNSMDNHFGSDAEKKREVVEKIMTITGREDEVYSDFAVPSVPGFESVDATTDDVVNGPVTKSVDFKSDSLYESNLFYTSQVLNRKTKDDTDKPDTFGAYYEFEYMGSSEYEYGAIPKAIRQMREAPELQYAEHKAEINGVERTVYFVGPNVAPAIASFEHGRENMDSNYGRMFQQKASGGFEDAFAGGGYKAKPSQTVWMALNEDDSFLYTLDKDRALDAATITRRGSHTKQDFSKVDVTLS